MLATNNVWIDFVKRREPSLRERLILQYAPLVRYVIDRLAISFPAALDSGDIYSCGIIGLIHAVDRFDPKRGVKFETYAISRIRGAIIDELRKLDPISRSTRQRARQIEQTYAQLQEELGRPATEVEVAQHLGLSPEAFNDLALQLSSTTISLDSAFETEDGGETVAIADLIEDKMSPNPTQLLERKELTQRIARLLAELPERQRLVLALYYYEDLTLREISEVMGLSESRVCQIHTQAILRLRALLKKSDGGLKNVE